MVRPKKTPAIDHAVYRSIFFDIFPQGFSKSELTKVKIIEGAISGICQEGIQSTTYESIAAHAGVTKQLVKKYFPEKTEIFDKTFQYIRANFQHLAIDSLSKESSIDNSLRAYVRSCFEWPVRHADHFQVWLLFFHYAATFDRYKKMNSDLAKLGQERIAAMISSGVESKVFECDDPKQTARHIQSIITGGLVVWNSEQPSGSHKHWAEWHTNLCMSLVMSKSSTRKVSSK
jgi:AcrR family transcriptional regulator